MNQDYHTSPPGRGFAIASLVLGIISILFAGIILGPLGIIFAVVASNQGYKGGMLTAGLVCSIIGTSLAVMLCVACIFCPAFLDTLFWYI